MSAAKDCSRFFKRLLLYAVTYLPSDSYFAVLGSFCLSPSWV